MATPYPIETHEQFLLRAGRIFPVDSTLAWTRFERALFNQLMSRLIFRYDYASITDEMLRAVQAEMQEMARRTSSPPPRIPADDRGRLSAA